MKKRLRTLGEPSRGPDLGSKGGQNRGLGTVGDQGLGIGSLRGQRRDRGRGRDLESAGGLNRRIVIRGRGRDQRIVGGQGRGHATEDQDLGKDGKGGHVNGKGPDPGREKGAVNQDQNPAIGSTRSDLSNHAYSYSVIVFLLRYSLNSAETNIPLSLRQTTRARVGGNKKKRQ